MVQKSTDIMADMDAAWTMLAIRGVVLFIILYIMAPYIAGFFGPPGAVLVLQVIGITLILEGLTNLGTIFFLKELNFKRQFLFQFSGVLADFTVAVITVLVLHSVALVFGLIAKDLTLLVVSYAVHPYRPHLNFDLGKVKGLSNYGMWILFSSVLVFFLIQGDDVLVGHYVGLVALGLYEMAYGFSNTPSTEVSQVISQVAFPVYSKVQDDPVQLKDIFLRTYKVTSLVAFLLVGSLVSLAPDITIVFLGSAWSPIVPLIQVLAWWGLIRGLEETAAALFMAIGIPRIYTILQLFQVVLFLILIMPMIEMYGILGVSITVVVSAIPIMFLTNRALVNTLNVGQKELTALLFYPFMIALAGIVPVSMIRSAVFPMPSLVSFGLLLFVYTIGALSAVVLIDRFTCYEVLNMPRDKEFHSIEGP